MDNTQEIETPKIAEKVRFWEEQDRINQELIPRVIKQHELFTAHIEGHETTSIRIGAVEAHLREAVNAARKQTAEEMDAKISALETGVSESIDLAKRQAEEEASKQLSALEADMTATVGLVKRQAMTVFRHQSGSRRGINHLRSGVMMTMQSLELLPELRKLPVSEDAQDLGYPDTVLYLRTMGKDHFAIAIEVSEIVESAMEGLFDLRNVPDVLTHAHDLAFSNYDGSLYDHYQEMLNRGPDAVRGFINPLKGKVAEIRAEDLLEDRFPGYDLKIAESPNQPGWDLHGFTPDGQEILVQVKIGSEDYASQVLEQMQDDPGVLFATSTEIYDRLLERSPELAGQLIDIGISNTEFTESVEQGLNILAANEGFDVPDSLAEMLPYAGEIILGIRLVMDIVSTEREFKDVQLQDRSRVHALKALVLMSKFGITTVFTTAGGAAGGAAGTVLLPGVGSAAGSIVGSIAGTGAAAFLNRRLQPQMMQVGMAIAGVDEDDMFYFRNKRAIDDLGASLATTTLA